MRTYQAAAFAIIAGCAVLFGGATETSRASTGDLSKQQVKQLEKEFNQIVKQHKQSGNNNFKVFKQGIGNINKDVKSGTADPFQIFFDTTNDLDFIFDGSLSSTRNAIAGIEGVSSSFYAANTGVPDSIPELSGAPGSLIDDAVGSLNANNGKLLTKIRKLISKLEKAACKEDIPPFTGLRGIPEFQAPHVERTGFFGSGMTENRANIIFTTSGGQTSSRVFSVLGYFDFDPLDNDETWTGLFDPDGTELDRQELTPSTNGVFRGGFSTSSSGTKNIGVDIFDPDDDSLIFADGFESGDTSAWTNEQGPIRPVQARSRPAPCGLRRLG